MARVPLGQPQFYLATTTQSCFWKAPGWRMLTPHSIVQVAANWRKRFWSDLCSKTQENKRKQKEERKPSLLHLSSGGYSGSCKERLKEAKWQWQTQKSSMCWRNRHNTVTQQTYVCLYKSTEAGCKDPAIPKPTTLCSAFTKTRTQSHL